MTYAYGENPMRKTSSKPASTLSYAQKVASCSIHRIFVFCQEEVDFLGFTVTLDSLKPAAQMLRSIQEFPTPSDIRGIRSFFGLVNQVSFAFSMTETMAPFRALLKPSTHFYWDDALQKLFNNAKTEIVEQTQNGVRMFDKSRVTCLATDWSKTGG